MSFFSNSQTCFPWLLAKGLMFTFSCFPFIAGVPRGSPAIALLSLAPVIGLHPAKQKTGGNCRSILDDNKHLGTRGAAGSNRKFIFPNHTSPFKQVVHTHQDICQNAAFENNDEKVKLTRLRKIPYMCDRTACMNKWRAP